MADDRIKVLEERLTRLESLLSQSQRPSFPPPGGGVVDPATWAAISYRPRPAPSPVVDPAPWWTGGWGYPRWPTPVVDPAPWPTPVVDPAPMPYNPIAAQAASFAALGRIGHVGDPPPIDLSRFNVSQLESALHSIAAERARTISTL